MNQLRRASALLLRRLRLDLRGATGHLVRLFGAGMLLIAILAAIENSRTIGSPGLAAFRWVVWCDAFLISAASITVFAAVIAGEREGGTLGLLRMTGTSPLTLLLGQGASGILIGCLLLAIQFPFIVLTITLGGVLWNQVLAAFLALLAHLVLSAGLGLFFSTACKRSGSAAFYALLCQVGLWLGPWIARWVAGRMNAAGRLSTAVEGTIAAYSSLIDENLVWTRLSEISTSFGITGLISSQFWWSIAAGVVLFGLSTLIMDYRPIEVSPSAPIILTLWKSARGRAWPSWPIPGKDFRQFMGGLRGVIARLIIYTAVPLGMAWGMNHYTDARLDANDVGAMVFWFGFAFLVIELNAIAARLFRNELAEQTWSTLTLLPRPLVSVVGLKLAGAAVGLIPAVIVPAIAFALSDKAREMFARPLRFEWLIPIVMTAFFVCATSLASMTLPSLPPTVLIFCGLLAYFVHYALTILAVFALQSRQMMNHDNFNLAYGSFWSLVSACFLIAAFVRLRKLTASN